MMSDYAMLFGGAVLLYFGAEWLVGGAAGLALALRVPQLVVGLTVVAYGTSAPEVIVSVQAALADHAAVAVGNVLGSNIANLGLILAVATLLRPAVVDGAIPKRELPVLVGSALCLPATLWDGVVRRWEAGLLLLGAVAYSVYMLRSVRGISAQAEVVRDAALTAEAADVAGAPKLSGSRARLALIAIVGLGVLLLGGQLFVTGATALARSWGMSERIVGLTIVAIGTSLPELVTSVVAALRGHSDIAVGNVIGSNIFNVLLCLGSAGLLGTIAVAPGSVTLDVAVCVGITLLAAIFVRSARTIRREEGAVLGLVYLAFLGYLVFAGGG